MTKEEWKAIKELRVGTLRYIIKHDGTNRAARRREKSKRARREARKQV